MGWTDKFKSILKAVIPSVGTALGGPAGGLASKFLSDKLLGKPDATDQEIESYVLGASPEQLIQMKQLDIEWQKFSAELNFNEKKLRADALREQVELNKAEAQSKSLFVSGWRPFVGWICGSGFGYAMLGRPILLSCGINAPKTDTEILITTLFALLGLGGMRMAEKFKGVASK